MTDTKLLPCPFCGGDAKYVDPYWYSGTRVGNYVRCTKCSAQNERPRLVSDPTPIDAWNKRAAPTDTKPVAWMYWPSADTDELPFTQPNRANMDPRYWTETPLYAAPQPCTDCAALAARGLEVRKIERDV